MHYRTKEENMSVTPTDVVKYHSDFSRSFNTAEINKVKAHLRFYAEKVVSSNHYHARGYQKRIPNIDFRTYMKYGQCFEYKMVEDSLYRFAVRLKGRYDKDYIAVFQPQYNDGQLEVVIITCYANKKDDQHYTLRTNEYAA